MEIRPGQELLHYRIVEKIGVERYLAEQIHA